MTITSKTRRLVFAVLASAVMLPAAQASNATPSLDPLAGDTWHAMTPSWPGTIKFDGEKKTVVLEPLGAPVIEATYEVKVTKQPKPKPAIQELEGELKMRAADGRTSEATFQIKGSDMKLKFPGIPDPEHYKRMTAQEQQEAMKMLQDRVNRGEIKLPSIPE